MKKEFIEAMENVMELQEKLKKQIIEMHEDVTPDLLTEKDKSFLFAVANERSKTGEEDEVAEIYNDYLQVVSNLSAFQ
jgi:hypothetical protein